MANVSSASIVGRLGTGSIVKAKLEADIIDSTKLADDSVNSEHYVDGSIDTAHIANAQITSAKIADDAVISAKIADGNVQQAHLDGECVNESKIQISNAGTDGQFLSKQSGNAGGLTWATVSSTAADFTVTANNSTDETVYPVFVDGATGAQGAETDTGLTYNPSTGMLTSTGFTGALTGNSSTATKFASAVNIGGVSFDGSASINLPGVNTAGTENTTGSAATLTTARTIGGVSFNGSANIDLPGVNATGNQNTSGSSASCTGNAATASSVSGSQGAITAVGTLTGLHINGNQTQTIKNNSGSNIYCSWGNYFSMTISSNTTLSFQSVPSNSYAMILEVDHNGGSITWPSSVKWNGDSAPTLTTGKTHQFYFHTKNSGSRWRGAALADYVD
jgi:hypothetical protein